MVTSLRCITIALVLSFCLSACGRAAPAPISAAPGNEFALVAGQSASVSATGLTIQLVTVINDERCPSEIECAASGPVTIQISVQKEGTESVEFVLQTFTNYEGRAPEGPFQGIQDRVEFEGYLIRVVGVLPYPATLMERNNLDEYSVSFFVTKQ